MSAKWKSSIPVAGVAAVAALAFPGIASAAVNANVAAGVLTVTGDGSDAITISCDAGGNVAVANADAAPADGVHHDHGDRRDGRRRRQRDHADRRDRCGLHRAHPDDDQRRRRRRPDLRQRAGRRDARRRRQRSDHRRRQPGRHARRVRGRGRRRPADLARRRGRRHDERRRRRRHDPGPRRAGVPEAFTVKPSATAGRVIFDRLATPGPGPFNLDIGTAETLDLNANGGDDSLATEAAPTRASSSTSAAATATTPSTAATPPT